MTKKKWLILIVLFIIGYPIVNYLGGEIGRKQASDPTLTVDGYMETDKIYLFIR
jgi:hypothetical protein